MHHSRHRLGPYAVDLWEEGSQGGASQDESLVLYDAPAHRLRLAVVDGVTPHPDAETYLGVDAATAAAETVRLALKAPVSVEQALDEANALLLETHDDRRLRPQAQVVVAELVGPLAPHGAGGASAKAAGRIQLTRAGDCVAYLKRRGAWQEILGDPVPAGARLARIAALQDLSLDELVRHESERFEQLARGEIEDELLGSFQPLGCRSAPALESLIVSGWQELVLASDGARLDTTRVAQLERWLAGLRAWEETAAAAEPWKRHDDLTVLRLRKA